MVYFTESAFQIVNKKTNCNVFKIFECLNYVPWAPLNVYKITSIRDQGTVSQKILTLKIIVSQYHERTRSNLKTKFKSFHFQKI